MKVIIPKIDIKTRNLVLNLIFGFLRIFLSFAKVFLKLNESLMPKREILRPSSLKKVLILMTLIFGSFTWQRVKTIPRTRYEKIRQNGRPIKANPSITIFSTGTIIFLNQPGSSSELSQGIFNSCRCRSYRTVHTIQSSVGVCICGSIFSVNLIRGDA